MKKQNFRSRVHHLVIYPFEDETHKEALEYIIKNYSHAFIHHAFDTWEDDVINDDDEIIHKKGENKKIHTHVIIEFKNAVYRDSLCKELKITPNYDKYDTKRTGLLYLIHYNNIDKYQYPLEDVQGNLKQWLIEFLNKKYNTDEQNMLDIMHYIDNQNYVIYSNILKWACKNGYWSSLRRGGIFITKYIDEHNAMLNVATDNFADELKKLNRNLEAEKVIKEIFDDGQIQINFID